MTKTFYNLCIFGARYHIGPPHPWGAPKKPILKGLNFWTSDPNIFTKLRKNIFVFN